MRDFISNLFPFTINTDNGSINLILDSSFYYYCEGLGFKGFIFDLHSNVVNIINKYLDEPYTSFVLMKMKDEVERFIMNEKSLSEHFNCLIESYNNKHDSVISDAKQRIKVWVEQNMLPEVDVDEQVVVYYNGKYCGKMKRGVNPTRKQIEDRIIDCGYYECEVRAYLEQLVVLKVVKIPEK